MIHVLQHVMTLVKHPSKPWTAYNCSCGYKGVWLADESKRTVKTCPKGPGPRLQALINAGHVRLEQKTVDASVCYVGIVNPRFEVDIGYSTEHDTIERYLEAHPTPDTW